MPTITTTHLGKPQDAAATSKAAPEQHEDHGPLWDGVIHPLRLHISVAHEMSSAASPAPSLLNCSGTFPSGTAQSIPGSGQDQGQGASRGTGSPGRILQGQNQPLAGKPIPRSPTHFPAVWTGTAFAPHANLSLCCKSPPPVTLQHPDRWVLPRLSQSLGTTIILAEPGGPLAPAIRAGTPPAHHTASGKHLYSVFQQLCLPAGWCLGITKSSQVNNFNTPHSSSPILHMVFSKRQLSDVMVPESQLSFKRKKSKIPTVFLAEGS